jgi:hypothetical protein
VQPVSLFARQDPLLANQESDQFGFWVNASAKQKYYYEYILSYTFKGIISEGLQLKVQKMPLPPRYWAY